MTTFFCSFFFVFLSILPCYAGQSVRTILSEDDTICNRISAIIGSSNRVIIGSPNTASGLDISQDSEFKPLMWKTESSENAQAMLSTKAFLAVESLTGATHTTDLAAISWESAIVRLGEQDPILLLLRYRLADWTQWNCIMSDKLQGGYADNFNTMTKHTNVPLYSSRCLPFTFKGITYVSSMIEKFGLEIYRPTFILNPNDMAIRRFTMNPICSFAS